ncbi:MAG: hypothetical protein RIC16_07625 [Rhodospirillales bacterium]
MPRIDPNTLLKTPRFWLFPFWAIPASCLVSGFLGGMHDIATELFIDREQGGRETFLFFHGPIVAGWGLIVYYLPVTLAVLVFLRIRIVRERMILAYGLVLAASLYFLFFPLVPDWSDCRPHGLIVCISRYSTEVVVFALAPSITLGALFWATMTEPGLAARFRTGLQRLSRSDTSA